MKKKIKSPYLPDKNFILPEKEIKEKIELKIPIKKEISKLKNDLKKLKNKNKKWNLEF